ncbi:hypothetical protein MMC20_003515 [Loxospora ochrophaea]|nr:hypothetical protein [Loxospora ochrophaea]
MAEFWQKTAIYKDLQTFFRETIFSVQSLEITSCMCLGLGSLAKGSRYNWSMYQLVAFESWITLLKTQHDIKHIYFQDPVFNSLDVEFLQSKGYTVIQNPKSESLLSSTTFLYSAYCEGDVVQASLAAAHPALYIGDDLRANISWMCCGPKPGEPLLREPTNDDILPMGRPEDIMWRRNVGQPFLNSYVSRAISKTACKNHLVGSMIYYKPDSDHDLIPTDFAIEESMLLGVLEAHWIWQLRGLIERCDCCVEGYDEFMAEAESRGVDVYFKDNANRPEATRAIF